MSVDINEILNSIDKRIEGIVTRPNMWGGPEALELQMLQLLEFRSMLGRPSNYKQKPEEVRRLWWAFTAIKCGGPYNSPLFVFYKELSCEEFSKILGEFADYIRSKLPLEG